MQVAGLHRAVPSAALDKVFNCLDLVYEPAAHLSIGKTVVLYENLGESGRGLERGGILLYNGVQLYIDPGWGWRYDIIPELKIRK